MPARWLPSQDLEQQDDFIELYDACVSGNLLQARQSLSLGAPPNGTYRGQTPLAFAAEFGHVDLVNLLLQNGAKVSIKDTYGRTALHFAVKNHHVEVAKVLVGHGATLENEAIGLGGETEADIVRLKGSVELTRAVLYYSGPTTTTTTASSALPGPSSSAPTTAIVAPPTKAGTPAGGEIVSVGAPTTGGFAALRMMPSTSSTKEAANASRPSSSTPGPSAAETQARQQQAAASLAASGAVMPKKAPAPEPDTDIRNHTPPRKHL